MVLVYFLLHKIVLTIKILPMTKILFGIKHRQALDNVFSLGRNLETNNQHYLFNLICFFKLTPGDKKIIEKYNIKVHKIPNHFFISKDVDRSNFLSFIKLIKFHRYFKKNLTTLYKNDLLIISPGGFLLDQLCALFSSKNIDSYVLQSGFISIYAKNKTPNKKINLLTNIFSIFFDTFKVRKNLNNNSTGPIYLTFNDQYSNLINSSSDFPKRAITVGAPRFLYTKTKKSFGDDSGVLYIGSSALYENLIELHEYSKLQIIKLSKLIKEINLDLSFRPHPRDNYHWGEYLSDYDISILSKSDSLNKQIESFKYIVSERSTVVLQAILQGKLSFWINKENSLLDSYEFINLNSEKDFINCIKSGELNELDYSELHKKQLATVKKSIISYYGDEACNNVFDVIYKGTL